MSMLPLLMAFSGGNKTNGNNGGGMDVASVMNLMSAMNGNKNNSSGNPMDMLKNVFGGNQRANTKEHERANPNMTSINGMLSPEMMRILMDLAIKGTCNK